MSSETSRCCNNDLDEHSAASEWVKSAREWESEWVVYSMIAAVKTCARINRQQAKDEMQTQLNDTQVSGGYS